MKRCKDCTSVRKTIEGTRFCGHREYGVWGDYYYYDDCSKNQDGLEAEMKKKAIHYAVRHAGNLWLSACGLAYWVNVEMWTYRRKVTCKQCKKTKVFRELP